MSLVGVLPEAVDMVDTLQKSTQVCDSAIYSRRILIVHCPIEQRES